MKAATLIFPSLLLFSRQVFGSIGFIQDSPLKQLTEKSREVYEKFSVDYERRAMAAAMNSQETKEEISKLMKESGGSESTFKSLGEDPQISLQQLAFMYKMLNKSDLATATNIARLCMVDGLLISSEQVNLCQYYPILLSKSIENRLSIISSRIIFSDGLLAAPEGWLEHVTRMVKEMESAKILPDSLKYLLLLLKMVVSRGTTIDDSYIERLITPSRSHDTSFTQTPNVKVTPIINMPAPPATNVTVDARSLLKSKSNSNSTNSSIDPVLARIIPNMLLL